MIQKFIECLIPVTACNLNCTYCYVIQENRRTLEIPQLDFSIDEIRYALRSKRFGGKCFFSLCGAGETLIPKYMPELIKCILENGHLVNVTTNGTLSNRFDEIFAIIPENLWAHLHFSFSLHYLELKRMEMLDAFFDNIHKIQNHGCSFVVQLNMCDDYMDEMLLEELKTRCQEEVGALPQVAVTRKENGFPVKKIELHTTHTIKEYIIAGASFKSPLFKFSLTNFMKRQKEFCYAGSWTFQLNLKTGLLKRCYNSCVVQNIFKHPNSPIMNIPVGHACNSIYCLNSSHFMALGAIPELGCPSYVDLRNRPENKWYTEKMKYELSGKLEEVNCPCTNKTKALSFAAGLFDKPAYGLYSFILQNKIKKHRFNGE